MFTDLVSTMLGAVSSSQPWQLFGIALLVYFIAGIIKGTLGIGFPTAAISLLAQFTDARTAITLVIMPMLFTNLWQVIRGRQFISIIRQLWYLLIAMLVFLIAFSQISSTVPVKLLAAILGVTVAAYALHSLYSRPLTLPGKWDSQAQLATGIVAGIMGGMVSVWAPPILVYLNARRLPKDQFVATAGVILLLGSFALLMGYVGSGVLTNGLVLCSLLLIAPSLIGFAVGERLRSGLSAQRFERLLLWFFFLMGLNLVRRGLF